MVQDTYPPLIPPIYNKNGGKVHRNPALAGLVLSQPVVPGCMVWMRFNHQRDNRK